MVALLRHIISSESSIETRQCIYTCVFVRHQRTTGDEAPRELSLSDRFRNHLLCRSVSRRNYECIETNMPSLVMMPLEFSTKNYNFIISNCGKAKSESFATPRKQTCQRRRALSLSTGIEVECEAVSKDLLRSHYNPCRTMSCRS